MKFPVFSSIRVYATAENWFGMINITGDSILEAMNNQGDDYGGGPFTTFNYFRCQFHFQIIHKYCSNEKAIIIFNYNCAVIFLHKTT